VLTVLHNYFPFGNPIDLFPFNSIAGSYDFKEIENLEKRETNFKESLEDNTGEGQSSVDEQRAERNKK